MIELLDDRVLVRRMEDREGLILTDKPKGIKGIVLATGPGKWIPGDWWKIGECKLRAMKAQVWPSLLPREQEYEWFPGHRQPIEVQPGMSVLFNSKWNDFADADHE